MLEWRKLSRVRKGDVCDDGSVIMTDPIRSSDGIVGTYAVKDPEGITRTDCWVWDEELLMRKR